MNQAQRSFLIKKISESVKARIDLLRRSLPEPPSLNTWLLHYVLSDKFQIKSIEEIKESIRQKALKSKDWEDWLGNSWGSASKNNILFKADEIFIIPEEYKNLKSEYLRQTKEIEDQISELTIQSDTLITRIQLSSDKTLQKLISEVDDMGDISLIDTKLKLLQ